MKMRVIIDLVESLQNDAEAEYMASMFQGNIHDDDPDKPPPGGPASNYVWREVSTYPISRLNPSDQVDAEWMKAEIEMHEPGRYDDMLDGSPIVEPIVVVEVDGHGYLWDGYHRVGASAMIGREALPAVVGTP